MNRVDRRLNALRDLLHVHVRGRCGTRMPKQSLNVLDRAFLLRQRGNRAPDHLKGQLGQPEVSCQLM